MSRQVKLAISGCCGRMGSAIAKIALSDFDAVFKIVSALEIKGHEAIGHDLGDILGCKCSLGVNISGDAKTALNLCDAVIEFTNPEVTIEHVKLAKQLKKPMVIGTTGLSDSQKLKLLGASKIIPIVFSPNMSMGVNVLFELSRIAADRLNADYDIEVVEAHHRHKKDSPSGTARRLAEVLAAARKQAISAIPVHAIRAGDIVGDHTVILSGPAERLELTHRAHNRDVFARGALRAALFVVNRQPGLYDMSDVLRS